MHEPRMPALPRLNDRRDEMSLVEYVRMLWRRRYWLIGGTVVGALVAIAVIFTTPKTYEATAVLIMANSKLGEDAQQATALSVATVRELVTTRAAAAKVIAQTGLDKAPYRMTPARLLQTVRVDEVRGTTVVRVSSRFVDPELATRVANGLASAAIDQLQRSNANEVTQTRDQIKAQKEAAAETLRLAQEKLLTYKRSAQLDLKRRDVAAMLDQRQELATLLVGIEEQKAWLTRAESELGKRTRVLTLSRSLDTEGTIAGAARSTPVTPLQMNEQQLDPVFSAIEQEAALRQAQLAGLEKKRRELVDRYKINAAEQSRLTSLYTGEITQARLEADHQLAGTLYNEIVKKYEDARLKVLSRSADLQILDPATTPDSPIAPRPMLYLLMGLLVGFATALVLVTLIQYVSTNGAAAPYALT
jgi:uncharacterized protein involved in exopolysaccharide biosynthesis